MQWFAFLIKVALCSGILFLFYHCILSKLTFFQFNRWFLIISLVLSIIIPLLTVDVERSPVSDSRDPTDLHIPFSSQPYSEHDVIDNEERASIPIINWEHLVLYAYLLISFLLLLKLVTSILQILSAKGEYIMDGRVKVILVEHDSLFKNSSFLTRVFVDKTLPAGLRELIINHEKKHLRSWHFIDKILANLHVVLFWFNPFSYAYFHAIDANHEYEVDDKMAKQMDKKSYAHLLISLTQPSPNLFINYFSKMPLKKRINMLYNKPTSPMKKLIYLSILPLLAVCFLAFTNKREVFVAPGPRAASTLPPPVKEPAIIAAAPVAGNQVPSFTKPVYSRTEKSKAVSSSPVDAPTSIPAERLPAVNAQSIPSQHLPSSIGKDMVAETTKPFVLVIDPGHGGSDNASNGIKGVREKDMNLMASLLLKEEAERRGMDVIMTRNKDEFVSLRDRVAAQKGGGAFISIHHNTKKSRGKHDPQVFNGLEVVTADQEASGISRALGEDVLRSLKKIEGVSVKDSLTRTSIYVLREALIPSILIEMGNISNPDNFNFVSDRENVRKVCNLILDGYVRFIN